MSINFLKMDMDLSAKELDLTEKVGFPVGNLTFLWLSPFNPYQAWVAAEAGEVIEEKGLVEAGGFDVGV